jgi:hypothetical protein
MKYMNRLLLIVLISVFYSCEEKMTEVEIAQIGIAPCLTLAPFIKKLEFDPARSQLSSQEPGFMGLVLVQFPRNEADSASRKTYQDRSWSQYGWMGIITSDIDGNTYTFPFPKGNTPVSPLSQMNKIYKVDTETGNMAVLTELPKADSGAGVVPFAVLGIYYDCHGKKIYASSVAGSTAAKEKGVIYALDPENGDIVDKLEGHDAMGVFVGGVTGEKRLYFGSARSSDIYSVELTKNGKFKGDVRKEFTLKSLGPRGNDKAARIRFDANGNMMVYGVEFNYGLAGQSEKTETLYQFTFEKSSKRWVVIQGR